MRALAAGFGFEGRASSFPLASSQSQHKEVSEQMAEDPADDISELFDKALTMIERGDDPKHAANWFRSQGPDAMAMLIFREMIAFDMATAILESKSSDVPGIASATWRGASGARKLAEFWLALYTPAWPSDWRTRK